jgi:hypothetical protein
MTTETIDVTGLPETVVNSLRELVGTLRGGPSPAGEVQAAATTPEERLAAFNRLMDAHAVPGVVIDDSRESIYAGRE